MESPSNLSSSIPSPLIPAMTNDLTIFTSTSTMSNNSIKFNLNKFLNYYKDPNNPHIYTEPNQLTTSYYYTNKIIKRGPLSQRYIRINGEKLYITTYIKHGIEHILFTIPKNVNGVLWDDHYHFGLNVQYPSMRKTRKTHNVRAIFFHKTIQLPNGNKGSKTSKKCFFYDNIPLKYISRVKCVSDGTKRMKDIFPITSDDYLYIHEIIRRPFYEVKKGGLRKKTKRIQFINSNRTKKRIYKKYRL